MVLEESSFDSLMFFSTTAQSKITPIHGVQNTDQPATELQEEMPRLIADESGVIVFANQAFTTLSHYQAPIEGETLETIFGLNIQSNNVENGLYDVLILNNQKEISLQFNWVETIRGQRFLVASAEEITAGEKLLQYVSEKIEEKEHAPISRNPFDNLSFDIQNITLVNGDFISSNHNFTKILGYSFTEVQNSNIFDYIHPSHKEDYAQAIQNSSPVVTCCLHKNGENIWIEWNHSVSDNHVYSVGRDITALKRQQKKLSEAEAIGHIGQWYWHIGAETIQFSDQLFRIFGTEPGNFNPTLESVNSMIHHQDAGRMEQVFQRAIIEQKDYDMDFRIQRSDGEVRYIRCEGRCETDSKDEVFALYGIMQDVTDVTKRELDLRQAKDSVERAYAAKTQFLANMSHELRTPLNAIIGFSEMIERQLLGPIGTEKYLEYISGIRQSGEHLLDLISDILDMSKIEAGKYQLNLEKFNIAKVIRMASHMMEGRALDDNIKIEINITNEELQVVADRRAIMQIILNLLSNAVKFSKPNGCININLNERDKHFSIRIEDQGIGIPANKLANITMPFEQAESDYTREYEGSGLGLAITKELAEIHGGNLYIESTLDVGTTVIIRLPYEAK